MSDLKNTEAGKKWMRIVAKAWADEDYKRRLLEEPGAVLAEEGLAVPGVKFRVVEDTPGLRTLVIPPAPDASEGVENMEERLAAMMFPPWP